MSSGSNEGLGTEEASLHNPPSGTRLEADSVLLEEAEWGHQIGYWRPEPVKWKVRWHRGGSEDKRVGSEEASFQRPSVGPPCRTPLCHPVAERQLATGAPLKGRWCYVCRVLVISNI